MSPFASFPFSRHAIALAFGPLISLAAYAQGAAPESAANAAAVVEPKMDVNGFEVQGENPLPQDVTDATLANFVGPQRTLSQIEAAATALERALHDRGFVFHRIFVPAQKPKDGVIVLQTLPFKVGKVAVEGNQHFSEDNIRRSVPALQEGQTPDLTSIGRDVSAANANPSKQTRVTFKEGTEQATVDATVKVQDVNPVTRFVGATANVANSGAAASDDIYRISGGMQWSNLFDRDHVLTLNYATDPTNLGDVHLLSAFYQAPIYGQGLTVSGYFTYSDVDSGQLQQGGGTFDVSGSGRFVGLRLTQALARRETTQHSISVALDDRYFRNSTTFGGVPLTPNVASRVLSLRYQARMDETWGSVAGNLEYAANLGGGGTYGNPAHLANGASGKHWDAWRLGVEGRMVQGAWQTVGQFKLQSSNQRLVAGEQFGLGGATSVRGFADRVVSGDFGYQWNVESTGPELGGKPVRPVLFVEGGYVNNLSTGSERISGAGLGLRWRPNQDTDVSVDLAKALQNPSTETQQHPWRLHLGVSHRF